MKSPLQAGALCAVLAACMSPAAVVVAQENDETGEHPGWPRWCGKVYKTGYPAFEPGGHTTEPASNGSQFLHVQFAARHSIYIAGEEKGSFIVSAALSPWYGEVYENRTSDGVTTRPFTDLRFAVHLADEEENDDAPPLVQDSIPVDVVGAEYEFDLAPFKPRLEPYRVVLSGTPEFGERAYTATAEFSYLPPVASGGSATKIDRLTGSILIRQEAEETWTPLLPYGYYGLYNGSNETAAADEFVRDYTSDGTGLNAIVSLAGFADTNPLYDSMDAQGLNFMFDLRGSYQNLTEVEKRVNTIKHRRSLFAYWTADEPDGWQRPFDAPTKAQALIHKLDPYHPVAVTLNCQDYYYGAYSAGGDVLMADVYPIGINATFSKWGTACNATLGDCGCDNCSGVGAQDVATRWDDLTRYDTYLGRWPRQPRYHNPQAFHGEDYWFRDPSPAEARVMNALALARGITGFFAWTWPGSRELFDVHTEMAKVVARGSVSEFLLAGQPEKVSVGGDDEEGALRFVEAALWKGKEQRQVLVEVVNGGSEDIEGEFSLDLPVSASGIAEVAFGGLSWELRGGKLSIDTLPAMSTSFIILDLAESYLRLQV